MVQPCGYPLHGEGDLRMEGNHLAERMDTGVGAACALTVGLAIVSDSIAFSRSSCIEGAFGWRWKPA